MRNEDTVRTDPGPSDESPPDETARLQIIRGEDIGSEFELKLGNNIVGRQKDCHIRINDKSISRRHAQIVYKPDDLPGERYIIYDLQSTNRTKVNNQVIERTKLRDGDRVQFGTVVCKFIEIDPLKRSYLAELKKIMEYDKQTDLLQIKPFYQQLEKSLADAENTGRPLSVLMMNLDGLKQINAAHGHLVGTQVVVNIARLVNQEVYPFGVAAVHGGDEFIGYLPNTDKPTALEKAERIRSLVDKFRLPEKEITEPVTISIGVAEFPSDALEMMPLVANADKALYVAKGAGKNCVVPYDSSIIGESTKK